MHGFSDLIVEKVSGWQIASARAYSGAFWSWGKMGTIMGTSPLNEPGQHVWMERALSREEAVRKLKEELGLTPQSFVGT